MVPQDLGGTNWAAFTGKPPREVYMGKFWVRGMRNELTEFYALRVVSVAPSKLHFTCTLHKNRQDAETGGGKSS